MPKAWATSESNGQPNAVPPVRPAARAAARGKAHERLANALLERLPLGVAVINEDLRLLFWNEQAARLFGVPPMMAAGMPLLADTLAEIANLSQSQQDRLLSFAATHLEAGDRTEPESWLRLSLGRDRRIALQIRGLGLRRWMLVIDDGGLAPATMQNGAARGDAWLDPLTGLANRRHFNQILADLNGSVLPEARHTVLMIDLDRFAAVNERLGHPVGDALLCVAAQRLRRVVRDDDVLVRLGGDEFAILIGAGDRAEPLADRVLESMARPFLIEGHIVTLGASIGIAPCDQPRMPPDDLLRRAELALYDAKSAGRGTWRVFDPDTAAGARVRRDLETSLRKALTMGGLSLAYQPRLNPRTQVLTGFEALPRWQHPALGAVSPGTFVPLAEEIGCIVALSEWVLTTACQEASQWPVPLSVAVKLSARQVDDAPRLADAVHSALKASGLPARRLALDITEAALLDRDGSVLDTLARLHAGGVQITMDDHDSADTPAGQLAFPFDRIKLTRMFVADGREDWDADGLGAAFGDSNPQESDGRAAPPAAGGTHDAEGPPIHAADVAAFLRRHAAASSPSGPRAGPTAG